MIPAFLALMDLRIKIAVAQKFAPRMDIIFEMGNARLAYLAANNAWGRRTIAANAVTIISFTMECVSNLLAPLAISINQESAQCAIKIVLSAMVLAKSIA